MGVGVGGWKSEWKKCLNDEREQVDRFDLIFFSFSFILCLFSFLFSAVIRL